MTNTTNLSGKPFYGNSTALDTLNGMIERGRIPQTLLIGGPEGVGKATLARRFAAELLQYDPHKIELDDLSLEVNASIIADREKWPSDKRNDDPLVFSSHPDFLTFPPDGPLQQLTIQQMRLLKERSTLKPLKGNWRVFLIDGIERANSQAANSLLKILEEPPSHLILVLTTRNPYDLLPTIRSRAVQISLSRLPEVEMRAFISTAGLDHPERRLALAEGAPGLATSVDLETYDRRRTAMLALLKVAAGMEQFGSWMKHSDSIAARRTEKLEAYLEVLYALLEDLMLLLHGAPAGRNADIEPELRAMSAKITFDWIRRAVTRVDEVVELARRNIQKSIAFDALAVGLRSTSAR